MSDIQIYLLEVDKNKAEARNVAARSAAKLEAKEVKLIDLITSLEDHINDKNDGSIRAKTLTYLAEVLEQISPKTLSGQERRLLCDFVLSRVESDSEGIGACARALIALEARGKWDTELSQKVTKTFMSHTHPLQQFRLQTERFPIVQLMDMLLAKYRTPLKALHESDPTFLSLFITYFEGEKDPRNLMMIFSLLQVPMVEWDVQAHAQDLFEAVFNYFPITFKPPPDDPYGITAQDLKDRLRDCIAANSEFAPHAFPALLDKLDSSSMNTKRDSVQAIQACALTYGVNTINLYSVTLWDALKFEVLNVQEEDIAEEALKALAAIAVKVAQSEGPLNAYLRPIIKECNEHLEDAPTKQSAAAGRILYTVTKASPLVADKITKGVLPALFGLYQGSNSITKRRGLLEVYGEILGAFQDMQRLDVTFDSAPLRATSGDALEAAIQALAKAPKIEVSFRLTALKILTQLTCIPAVLHEKDIDRAVGTITNLILLERVDGHGDITTEAVDNLTKLAAYVPEIVRNKAIPAFMVELPDIPRDHGSHAPVLEAFAHLSAEQQVFDTVALRIKNKLNAARYQNAPRRYQRDLMLAMLYIFTFGSPAQENGVVRDTYFTEYVEPLIAQLQNALPSESDAVMTEVLGRLTNIVLRPQNLHFQSTVYHRNFLWISPTDSVIYRHVALLINKFLEPSVIEQSLKDSDLDVPTLLSKSQSSHATGLAFAVVKALLVQGRSGALSTKYVNSLMEHLPTEQKDYARRFAGLLASDDILTRENHCVVSGLYKQRLFNQTTPQLIEAIRSASSSEKPKYLIALSGLLRGLPYSIIESSLSSLVSPLLQSLDLDDPEDQDVELDTLKIIESILMHDPAVVAQHTASLITRLLNATSVPAHKFGNRAKALQCLILVPKQLKPESVLPYRRPVVKQLLECLDDAVRSVRGEAVRCRSAWLALDEGKDDDE
ncbi:ARM repeat-containing protein [Dissoconium aciculare CBS 342.82]|uniref:MMS19 nucleotide excision repair protein n=1 Tax=Dissoconium aciculare CBS 342.82 TaxID=1314786 RepID=A0A6J3LZH1_9PEZI|nr:ARM repeat-containing protein [Dissoconium aciculare CBS 342.82]KAF1821166.1 ARM repeat-containing protein [Dissoconium aciculare CBS 342.82]